MTIPLAVVEGILKEDGSLELVEKLPLPAGRVQVTVVPLPDLPADDPFWQRMQSIWKAQRLRGHRPRSVAEVEGEREVIRQEWEERMKRIEQIQAEAEQMQKPLSWLHGTTLAVVVNSSSAPGS